MEIIKDILNTTFHDVYLIIALVFILIIAALFVINIFVGTIIGTHTEKFSLKKFLFGFVKGIAVCVSLFAFCIVLDIAMATVNYLPDTQIDSTLISVIEIIYMLITQCVDLSKEVIEKLKTIRELKYSKYDDIKVPDDSEPGTTLEEDLG